MLSEHRCPPFDRPGEGESSEPGLPCGSRFCEVLASVLFLSVPIDVHSHSFVLLLRQGLPDLGSQPRLPEWLGRLRRCAQGHAAG